MAKVTEEGLVIALIGGGSFAFCFGKQYILKKILQKQDQIIEIKNKFIWLNFVGFISIFLTLYFDVDLELILPIQFTGFILVLLTSFHIYRKDNILVFNFLYFKTYYCSNIKSASIQFVKELNDIQPILIFKLSNGNIIKFEEMIININHPLILWTKINKIKIEIENINDKDYKYIKNNVLYQNLIEGVKSNNE